MKIAVFDDYRLGVVRDRSIRDISSLVDQPCRGHPLAVNRLIERWDECARRLLASLRRP